MRRYMPSNILLDLIRTRRGLKWGVPAMLLAIPYFGVAYWCTTIIGNGGPGWLNLVVLICVWSGLKMMWIGPVSLIHLLRARTSERRARRMWTSSANCSSGSRCKTSENRVSAASARRLTRRAQTPSDQCDRASAELEPVVGCVYTLDHYRNCRRAGSPCESGSNRRW